MLWREDGDYGAASAEDGVQPAQTALFKAGYRVRLNDWSFVQPFAQIIARPDRTPAVADAAILGIFLGVDF